MGFDTTYTEQTINLKNPYALKQVEEFLTRLGFDYNPDAVDYTMVLYEAQDNKIAGTGSYQNNVLKYVAVAPEYRERNAAPVIVTHLVNLLMKKYQHIFAFTRPENTLVLESLGFKEVATAAPLYTLLEFGYRSIRDYQEYLRSQKVKHAVTRVATIVVNCNPFTNGHKYLIETTAAENDVVYLFVVEEERSVFPFKVRWQLVSEGTKHLPNVIMLKGGPYVVSGATFPSYFLKKESVNLIIKNQTELDVTIFAKYIVPVLEIKKRYVGTEPYSLTTAAYNAAMKKILPEYGVEIVEIERKADGLDENGNPNYISATKLRKAILENRLKTVMNFLPPGTQKYVVSHRAELAEKIKQKLSHPT